MCVSVYLFPPKFSFCQLVALIPPARTRHHPGGHWSRAGKEFTFLKKAQKAWVRAVFVFRLAWRLHEKLNLSFQLWDAAMSLKVGFRFHSWPVSIIFHFYNCRFKIFNYKVFSKIFIEKKVIFFPNLSEITNRLLPITSKEKRDGYRDQNFNRHRPKYVSSTEYWFTYNQRVLYCGTSTFLCDCEGVEEEVVLYAVYGHGVRRTRI